MKNRPLLFILIAFWHILEPVIKIAYFKATTPFALGQILDNITHISTAKELFEFWFLFPIGGLALIGVKRWSYPVFVGVQAYSIWSHLTYQKFTWPYVSEVPFFSSLILLMVNVCIIIYFALPDVRRPFFDRKLRWWETPARIVMRIPCTISIENPEHLHDCEILNISRTGAFINYKGVIEDNAVIHLKLLWGETAMELSAIKVSSHSFDREHGIGVHFKFKNIWEDMAMRKLVKELAKLSKRQERVRLAA